MGIDRVFFRQTEDQVRRGSATYKLTLGDKPPKGDLSEQYIAHALRLGYAAKENASFSAIEFEGKYLVRIRKKNGTDGFFTIRYHPNDFPHDLFGGEPSGASGKKCAHIDNMGDLEKAVKMLSGKMKKE